MKRSLFPREEELLEDPFVHGSSEPDRRPAPVVRAFSADEPAPRGAGSVGPPGGLHERVPVRGLPGRLRAAVRQVRDRQLGVQVRQAQGPRAPAHGLPQLRRADRHGAPARGDRLLRQVRRAEPEQGLALRRVRQPGRPADEVLGGRVPGAGNDLLGPAQGHLPALRLRQGPGHGRQDDARRQGRGSLLRRHPPDDRARDVRHQRDRARHRVAAPPFARRLLHEGVGARLPRQDHSVPRLVGRVRVRPEGRALRPHRPQAQVPGDDLPPGPRARDGRGDPAPVLRPRPGPLRARPRPPDRHART